MLDGSSDYGHAREGKTDPFPRGAWDNDMLRMGQGRRELMRQYCSCP